MNPEQVGYSVGYWIGVFFGGFIVGALCGLIPLILGRKRGRGVLAWAGWIACVISGMTLGLLLAIPVSFVFSMIIVCLGKSK